jgi:hypothetical protein
MSDIVIPDAPCPNCGNDPKDDSLHKPECPRILSVGDPYEHLQFGPPWEPVAVLAEPGWIERMDHGRVHSLHYPDFQIRIEHACRVVEGVTLITAPALQLAQGHVVTQVDPLTITPSILCTDCGLHGFITNGVWHE